MKAAGRSLLSLLERSILNAQFGILVLTIVLCFTFLPHNVFAADESPQLNSIADTSIEWPSFEQIWRVVTLRDYNTRVVVLGVMFLGTAAGIIGSFMLLRKRALLGDALSHATLPGIGIAFIVMTELGYNGKSLPVLLTGAAVTGVLGVLWILLIRKFTRLKEDAALGIVLSVFFGIGVAVLGIIQKMNVGNAAGLESFIYGKTASMLASDAKLIAATTLGVAVLCALFFKEFELLCFDQSYARTQGWPVAWLDLAMMTLVTIVTVIGLQAVGLILIIAMLIIPPAAARFWTNHLPWMIVLAAGIGAASGMFGASLSALIPGLPAGAIIVVVASCLFLVSMIFGVRRGVLIRWIEQRRLTRKVGRDNLLRALFEWAESRALADGTIRVPADVMPLAALLAERSWSAWQLKRVLHRAANDGLAWQSDGGVHLSSAGMVEARRVARNHRLWEMYLITHADIAPSHVDRDADLIEHVVGQEMVDKLQALLNQEESRQKIPASPHELSHGAAG